MLIVYFIPDASDPAVRRRVRMLKESGADILLIGFRRVETAIIHIEGMKVIDLGYTENGRLGWRILSLLRAGIFQRDWMRLVREAEVLMARNLDMLVLLTCARRYAPNARVVYEVLDIHRLMLSQDIISQTLRLLERLLLNFVNLLIVSSYAYIREYFVPRQIFSKKYIIVENKPLYIDVSRRTPKANTAGPPWRIGWFGMIRCRRSFQILNSLAASLNGRVQIIIRGRPSLDVIPDFFEVLSSAPYLSFEGPYIAEDLPSLYGSIHFSWAIDYFEEGLNSAWLLPNRLYEGSIFGAIPIALRVVETGRWLIEHGAGMLVESPALELTEFFNKLDYRTYKVLRDQVEAIPRSALCATRSDTVELTQAILGFAP